MIEAHKEKRKTQKHETVRIDPFGGGGGYAMKETVHEGSFAGDNEEGTL